MAVHSGRVVIASTVDIQSPQQRSRDVLTPLLWVLIGVACGVRILTTLQYNPIGADWSDPGRHWEHARVPLQGDPMAGMDPLLYQVWLACIAKITIGDHLAVGIYAGLLSAVTPFFWYLCFRQICSNDKHALAGWAVLAWLPSWIGIYSYFMNETLLLPLLGLALAATLSSMREKTRASLVGAAFAWTAAALTRAIAAPLGLVAMAYALRAQPRERLRSAFLVAAIAAAFLLPAAYRTYRIMGVWAPFGAGGMNRIYMESGKQEVKISLRHGSMGTGYMYGFMSPAVVPDKQPLAPLSSWSPSRTGTVNFIIDMDKGSADWKLALQQNRAPLFRRLRMQWENTVLLFFDPSWTDNNFEHFWERMAVYMRWVWLPLFLVALYGDLVYFRRHRRWPLVPVLCLLGWILCMTTSAAVVEGRYRKPLEGLLIANLLWLWSSRQEEEERRGGTKADSCAVEGATDMPAQPVELSLVIPCYNEEHRIGPTLDRLLEYLPAVGVSYELIVVNAGSTDGTADVVRSRTSVRLLDCRESLGKGHAVRSGMLAAQGRVAIFTDADLATPAEEIPRLMDALQTAPVAIGIRVHPDGTDLRSASQTPLRQVLGKVFNRVACLLVGSGFPDTQCGFKGFRREVIEPIFTPLRTYGLGFDVEVLVRARRLGYEVAQMPVQWSEPGGSRLRANFKFAWSVVRDLYGIWRLMRAPSQHRPQYTG